MGEVDRAPIHQDEIDFRMRHPDRLDRVLDRRRAAKAVTETAPPQVIRQKVVQLFVEAKFGGGMVGQGERTEKAGRSILSPRDLRFWVGCGKRSAPPPLSKGVAPKRPGDLRPLQAMSARWVRCASVDTSREATRKSPLSFKGRGGGGDGAYRTLRKYVSRIPTTTAASPAHSPKLSVSPSSSTPSMPAVIGLNARKTVTRVGDAWPSAHNQRK